ncbi:threonine/serine ThrE exporter family protein [Lacticaseibacillus sharpeae]|uniref:Integral membrane protein n=1 Tax=Lacticaseibacillus sharpeae JCM 1186 = DSM 20505 TaxID=1291052 RepID=A0A0R1ZN25_9LACO|nr:threonine/serine exporter family protein [Lacticaseibacillus sharpeae]KRM55866.1 integral membrane protein [Lacticaseibacillus sharpeae JCM 1186 = DSM 20505]
MDSEELRKNHIHLTPSAKHHMTIHWHNFVQSGDKPITESSLRERATVVGRVGLIMLACGTGAWRVREAMNQIARPLGMTCAADVGLTTIEYSCFQRGHHYTQTLALPSSGVNTDKLTDIVRFVRNFTSDCLTLTPHEVHSKLDVIEHKAGNYTPIQSGLASAFACGAFVFLLGGGPIEMLCAWFGAGIGQYSRRIMGKYSVTMMAATAVSVALSCLGYSLAFGLLEQFIGVAPVHEAGYIGAMLFVIPGFPFITSGLDIVKSDMRSGLERATFAITVIVIATLTGWLVAMLVHFRPQDFVPLGLDPVLNMVLRLIASFVGVFGFSLMFNSPVKMAAAAGIVGAVGNTLRLELADLIGTPAAAAAFAGALVAGLGASWFSKRLAFPRISLTVPSIVIMVPGLYMYRAVYNLGLNNFDVGGSWLIKAALMVVALPLGLATARILTDPAWRHSG